MAARKGKLNLAEAGKITISGIAGAVLGKFVSNKLPIEDPKIKNGAMLVLSILGVASPKVPVMAKSLFTGIGITAGYDLAVGNIPKLSGVLDENYGSYDVKMIGKTPKRRTLQELLEKGNKSGGGYDRISEITYDTNMINGDLVSSELSGGLMD